MFRYITAKADHHLFFFFNDTATTEIYTYPAGHAFDREVDPKAYDAPSAKLALERTLAFFARHLGGA